MFKLIFFAAALVAVSFGDYCDWEGLKCRKGPHIGCDSEYDFDSKACRKWNDIELIEFSDEEIDAIVREHNIARSKTALGETIPGVTATRLCKMKWHDELALTASFNVWKCYDDHDECRNTEEFDHAGQNLYNSYSTSYVSTAESISKSINKWYDEYNLVRSVDVFDYLPRSINDIGHFTQMVKDNACYVGCAGVQHKDGSKNHKYIVCNYSYCNMAESPVFERGDTGSKCETGVDSEYPGLCSSAEEFDMSTPIKTKGSRQKGNSGGRIFLKGTGGKNKNKDKIVKNGGGGDRHHTYHRTVYHYRY